MSLPVRLTLVKPKNAEQIELRTNAALDKRMRRAITAKPRPNHNGSFAVATATQPARHWRGGLRLECASLPTKIAMRARFEAQSGQVVRLEYPLVARAGEPWFHMLSPGRFAEDLKPGTYQGHVILTPDRDAARPYGSIDHIWGGTLHVGMQFRIR